MKWEEEHGERERKTRKWEKTKQKKNVLNNNERKREEKQTS